MSRKVKIFSGKKTKVLAEKVCQSFDGDPLNSMKLNRFSDGEFITDIKESVRGCDVFVIQSLTPPSDNIWELFMIGDALKRASAEERIAVCPYLGYSRQDRKCNPREPIGAKMLADVIQAVGFTRMVTIDLHADQIAGMYNIPVDHLSASYIFIPYIKELNLSDLMFAAPDAGSVKNVKKYADIFGVDMAICHKHRPDANVVSEMKLIGDVRNKNVIIVDDLIDTANTLRKSADLIKESGALSVRAMITHPILSGDAYNNIKNSALTKLITTDTIPLKEGMDTSKIEVLSVDIMLSKAMHKINDSESIQELFGK